MLLALRTIVDADLPIPIRIGVNRGAIFAGDIGPFYRRTYTVMGDAVNLAARLMAKAQPGRDLRDRRRARSLEHAVRDHGARAVPGEGQGAADSRHGTSGQRRRVAHAARDAAATAAHRTRSRSSRRCAKRLPRARAGAGTLFELVGEAGIGKTRLAGCAARRSGGFRGLHAVCEAYTASTPYAVWQELLRELRGLRPRRSRRCRRRSACARSWRPRARISCRGCRSLPSRSASRSPPTPEVDMLAENNRRPKLHETVVGVPRGSCCPARR